MNKFKITSMLIVGIKRTKLNRFGITYYKRKFVDKGIGLSSKYNEHIEIIINKLKEDGFKEVTNYNGGDDDYLCIDYKNKEFIWCEDGFFPFFIETLNKIEISDKETTLRKMYDNRH